MSKQAGFFVTRDTTESVYVRVPIHDGESANDAMTRVWGEMSPSALLNTYADKNALGYIDWHEDDDASTPYLPDTDGAEVIE